MGGCGDRVDAAGGIRVWQVIGDIVYCPSCNSQIDNDSKFCPFCGHKFASRQQIPPGAEMVVIIGREPGSDIMFPQLSVSRRHARVVRSGDQYRVEDLGSKYGVWVGNTKVNIHVLQPHDVVRLSDDATLTFARIEAAFQAKYGFQGPSDTSPGSQPPIQQKPAEAHRQPMIKEQSDIYEKPLAEDIPTKKWIECLLLASVPIVGVVMLIVWMGDKKSPSRASWAKLTLILNVCFTVILLILIFTQIGLII